MTANTFPAQVALDPTTGVRAPNASGQVFDLTDTAFANPLEVLDTAGIPMTGNVVRSTADALVFPFMVEGYLHVRWYSSGCSVEIMSFEGIEAGLTLATQAAQAAQLSAASAVADVSAFIAGGGGGGTGSGLANTVYVVYAAGVYPLQPTVLPGVTVRIAVGPTQPTYPAIPGILDQYVWADL